MCHIVKPGSLSSPHIFFPFLLLVCFVCRLQLHQQLGLPANRPLLKFANAVDPRLPHGGSAATPAPGKAVRLQNVHEGIAEPAVKGGVVHMIDGTYDYHHYMQVSTLGSILHFSIHISKHVT